MIKALEESPVYHAPYLNYLDNVQLVAQKGIDMVSRQLVEWSCDTNIRKEPGDHV